MRSFLFFALLLFDQRRFFIIKTQFLQQIKEDTNKKWHISPLLILAGISFMLAVILSIYPNNIFQSKTTKKITTNVKGITYTLPTAIPTKIPTPTSSIIVHKTADTASPTLLPTNIPTPTIKSPAPQTQPITPTTQPTLAPKPTVNLQINEPDGTNNFSVTLNSGNNLCDNLTEAKTENKIKSVTLDYSYMSTMHSAYVKEINGYQNNWTVSINGKSPQGCSLYTPNPGDSIVWKFG